MKVYDDLKARGLIAQVTNEEEVRELIDNGKATFYVGFDVTADSLHVGSYLTLAAMRRLQMAGNRPIVLIGGGTTMVGDPSGKTDMRPMLHQEEIQKNGERFKKQMGKFLDFSEGKGLFVNNADWLLDLNYVDMLREVGAHFSVNHMLRAECYKQRMEKGLSFLELNYMIMQSYDFYFLFKKYGCRLQCGGDDQWSNLLGGTELIRRKTCENGKAGEDAYAMTFSLLLTADGKKMGKTQSGAVWLDPEKTSPYEFYQYWRNTDDRDVINCLRMLTFLPLDQIEEVSGWEGSQLNQAKEILAYELTTLVHSREEAERAQETSRSLFSSGGAAELPCVTIGEGDLSDGKVSVLELLVYSGLCPSKSEARRAVQQGGVEVDGKKIMDIAALFTVQDLTEGLIIRRGKKNFRRVLFK